MPLYALECPRGSIFEVFAPMSEAPSELPCPACDLPSKRHYFPLNARFEASDEIGKERNDETSGTYITLPDIPTERDKNGRMQFRPHNVADIPNRAAFKEAVKRIGGLSLGDSGRYRCTN